MANIKEIKDRINSIQDTMKITSAMYMISSSKLKKTKRNLANTEPYFYGIQEVVGSILHHVPDLENAYFDQRKEVKEKERKVGHIVITADKGLAGSYNHNIIKKAQEIYDRCLVDKDYFFVVGEYGRHYFARKGYEIDHMFQYTVQNPTMHRARVIAEKIIDLYLNKELDEINLVFTKMINGIQSEAQVLQLLPQKKVDFNREQVVAGAIQEEFTFYPTADSVMDCIIPNYITGIIFGALVESYSSEQNARMLAMEGATRSGQEMLRDLSIVYNRLRQAVITQQITEVVSGAKAQRRKRKK